MLLNRKLHFINNTYHDLKRHNFIIIKDLYPLKLVSIFGICNVKHLKNGIKKIASGIFNSNVYICFLEEHLNYIEYINKISIFNVLGFSLKFSFINWLSLIKIKKNFSINKENFLFNIYANLLKIVQLNFFYIINFLRNNV